MINSYLLTKLVLASAAAAVGVDGIPGRSPNCGDGASGPNAYCNNVQVNQQSLAISLANTSTSVSALSYTSFVGFPGSTLTQQDPFAISSFGNKYGNTTNAVTSANFSDQTQVDSAPASAQVALTPAQTASFPAQTASASAQVAPTSAQTQVASFPAQDPTQTASASAQVALTPAQTVPAQTQVASFPAQDPAQTQVDSPSPPTPTPTPTPTPKPTLTNVAQQNSNVGAIAGGAAGAAAFVALVGGSVYYLSRPGPTAVAQGSASAPAQLVFSPNDRSR